MNQNVYYDIFNSLRQPLLEILIFTKDPDQYPEKRLNSIKCWNSNELFELDLEYLSNSSITIVSLSTGVFNLRTEKDNIIVAVLFIQQDEIEENFQTKINFYENNYLGTVKDPSKESIFILKVAF